MMDFVTGLKERRIRDAFIQHARVVSALMLRDIKTRFGASYFGFIFGLMIPLGHLGIVLAGYILLARRAPIGTDVTLYLVTAILPFVIWSYTHQKLILAFGQNIPLTALPIVKLADIMIARALTELLNSIFIATITAIAIGMLVQDIYINDIPRVFYALMLSYALGVSTGLIFGILGVMAPIFNIMGFLFIPLYWLTCGVLFIPGPLPEQVRTILYYFPLAHIIDYGRVGFYSSYISDFPQLSYVYTVIIFNFLLAFLIDRVFRAALTSA